jgi:hypothetical protein
MVARNLLIAPSFSRTLDSLGESGLIVAAIVG